MSIALSYPGSVSESLSESMFSMPVWVDVLHEGFDTDSDTDPDLVVATPRWGKQGLDTR